MKEEMKKYFKIDIFKLEEERRKINDNYILYYDLLNEIKEKPEAEKEKAIQEYNQQKEERENKLNEINKKIDMLTIEKNLLYNNIVYLFYKNYHNIIIETMEKYKNKNIGEKTKEKIQDELKEILKKDGVFAGVWFSFGQYSCDIYKLNFTIYRTQEEQNNYSYNKIEINYELCNYYRETEKEQFQTYYCYRNEKTGSIIINNNKIWENNIQYNYIANTTQEAKRIIREAKKSIEKVNKLINEAKKEREKHNQLLNSYKINEFDNIKINYQQTL